MDVFDEIAPDVESSPQDVFDLAEQGSKPAVIAPVASPAFVPSRQPSIKLIQPQTERQSLQEQQEQLRSEEVPFTSKLAAKAASGIEKGTAMPEKAIRGALDFLGYYKALDAVLGTDKRYQDYNKSWLEYFNKRDSQLAKEDEKLGAKGFGYDVAEGATRAVVELPPQLLGGAAGAARGAAVKGAALTAGAIAGLSQFAQDRGEGRGQLESALYSAVSGTITGLTTAAFGTTGVESVFKKEGVKGVSNRILEVLKQAGLEGAEESVDQFQQDLLERVARNPNKPIGQSVQEVLLAGSVGALIGGAASSVHNAADFVGEKVQEKRAGDVFDKAIEQNANKIAALGTMPEMAQHGVRQLPRADTPEGAITPEAGTQVQRAIRKRRGATAPAEVADVKIPDSELLVSIQAPMQLGEKQMPGYVQIDSAYGKENQWSSNPDALRELGYDVPTKDELLTLPQGKYTLKQAKEKLKEIADEKAKPSPEVIAPSPVPVVEGKPVEPVAKGQVEAGVAQPPSADQAVAEPTEAQKEAGNYKKEHVNLFGLDISIENKAGSERTGTDKGGKAWSVTMPADYGYIRRTEGKDGDQLDVYVGKNPESGRVFVVNQMNLETGRFDEHKSFIGFNTLEEAQATYDAAFSDGLGPARRSPGVSEMTVDQFKDWVKNGDLTQPVLKGGDQSVQEKEVQGPEVLKPTAAASPEAAVTPEDIGPRLEGMIQKRLRGEKLTVQQNSLLKRMKKAQPADYAKYQQRLAQEQAKIKAGEAVVQPKQRGKLKGDLNAQGKRGWDLIDEAETNIGKISWKLIKEANPNWFPVGAARKIFAAEGTPADTAAQTLFNSGHYKGDPGQVDQFGDAMNAAATARKGNRETQARETRLMNEADRQRTEFEEDATKQTKKTEPVLVDELQVGDKFTLNKHELKVTDLTFDEDGRIESITFDDGKKYGTQQVDNQTLLGALRQDKGSLVKAEETSTDFVTPEDEKAAEPEKPVEPEKPKEPEPPAAPAEPAKEPVARVSNLETLGKFIGALRRGEVNAEQVKQAYRDFKASRGVILVDLNNLTIPELKKRLNFPRNEKKEVLIRMVLDGYGNSFAPKGVSYVMGEEGAADKALDTAVESWTDEEIQKQADERKQRREALIKSLKNPETLKEFDTFVQYHKQGYDGLTPEQKIAYDELLAAAGRELRNVIIKQQAAAPAVALPTGVEMKLVETRHTQKGHELFVVQINQRVDRAKFDELNTRAKKLGGKYSSYNKGGAVPGFTFKDKAAAEQFMSLEAVAGGTIIEQKQEAKKETGAAQLRKQAETLKKNAEFVLNQDRKVNTRRRADMASGIEGRARADLRLAETMVNLADAIESGEAVNLNGVRTKVHLEELNSIIASAKQRRTQQTGESYQKASEREANVDDIEAAQYPSFELDSDIVRGLGKSLMEVAGAKQMGKRLFERAQYTERSEITRAEAETIVEKLGKRGAWQVEGKLDRLKRLEAMGIPDIATLRAALREYLTFRGRKMEADPIKAAERALIGQKIPGFFPTPKPVAADMVQRADIAPGMDVLEPSAGNGNIADEIKAVGVDPTVIEFNYTLRGLLEKKGHKVSETTDFLEFNTKQDRIVMNPPFENGQDIDHVRHAYGLLKPGGKVVAIMSEGPFFRGDKKATEFREWLESVGGISEKLPENTFKGNEQLRETGVNGRMVEISKPVEKKKAPYVPEPEQVAPVEPQKQTPKFKQGDDILFVPKDRKQTEVSGIVVETIYNTDGEVGYHILSPLPGDPGRQIRIWERDGVMAIAVKKPAEATDFSADNQPTLYSKVEWNGKTVEVNSAVRLDGTVRVMGEFLDRYVPVGELKKLKEPAAAPAKPAEPSKLSPKQLKRLSELVKKQRAADEGGVALTPEENKELSDLRSVGQADLLAEPEGANEAAQRGEIVRLRAKAEELMRQSGLSLNRYHASKVQEVAAQHRDDANKLAQEAAAVRAEADRMERALRGEKPQGPAQQDDMFGGRDASLPQSERAESSVQRAGTPPMSDSALRREVNKPDSGVPAEMVRYINALLDSGLTNQIPGLRWAIDDAIHGGATGEYLPDSRLARFSTFADSTTPIHEFFHDVWYFLKPADQQAIRKLRSETIKAELGKTRNYAEVSALEKMLADEVTSDDFINSKYPHEIYHLSNEREFFTWLMTERAAKQFDSQPETKTFIGRIKAILQSLWTAIKDAVGLSPKADALWRKILSGKYEFTPEEGRQQEAREASLADPLKQAVKMAAIDPLNAARNVKAAQAGAEPVLGFMVREVQRLEAIVAEEATTPQQKLVRDVARRTLSGADFRRAIRRKVERFLSSKQYTDDAITTYDEAKAELDVPDATQEQRDKMSNIAGNAVNELVDIENKRTEFNENYESKRRDLVNKVASSTESEMEAYEKLEATETLLTDFRQMALPILRQSNDTAALQAYTYAMGRTEAVRRVLDFIGHEVDLTGARTPQDVERLIREAAGRSRIQEHVETVVGATRDVIQAVARIVALVEPIRERLTEARFLYGQQAGTRSTALKQRLEGLVRAGNYARALEVFGRGSEKVGAEHDRAVRELNFYARRTRSALITLRALDETKSSLDNIWNDPDFQAKRTEIFNRQGVASVTADLNGTTLVLNAFPGQAKLKLVFGNDVSAEKSTLEQIRDYKQNALAYIAGANPDPSIASGLKTTLPLLDQFLNSSFAPEAARLLPNWLLKGFNSVMSRVGSIERIPYYLLQGTGGAWKAIADASLRARRDMGEQLQRIHSEHFPRMGLKLHAALKAHGSITPDTYFDRVWNHLAASRQNFRDVRYLSEGDPIGNGEKVTKEDLAFLEAYRKFHADLYNTSTNNGKRHFSSFRTVLTGIFFDNNGRVRLPFAHGIDMVNRRAPGNTEISNWLKAWSDADKSSNKSEAKKAFLDSQFNRFVIGYMHGVNQADWVSKFKYSYKDQVQEVLAESNDQPIDSFDTLVDRVFEKVITEEGEVAPPTREDVEKNLLSDFDAIFKKLSRYDLTEKKTDPKTGVEIVISETEFNTERGNVIMPPNWYDYGGVTEGTWSSISRASMFPYERAHLAAMQGLQSAIANIVKDFKNQATSPSGRGLAAKGYFATRKQSRKARERGELIYSWADAEDLLRKVTHYAGKLRAMAESPMLLTEMDRPNVILQKGGIQVVVSALLLRIPAMTRNLLGGYTNAVLDDMAHKNRSFYVAIPARAAEVVADVYKNVLALLAHDGNPAGRSLYKLLSETSSWNVIGPVAEHFLKAVNEQRELYRDSAELGLNLNVAFWDSLSVLRKFHKTGGSVREPGNPVAQLLGRFPTSLRMGGLIMGQAGVGKVDSWINSKAYVQARQYEQVYKRMARKYGEQVAALGLKQFPPKAFGGEHQALRARDFFSRMSGLDIDAEMADYYKRWSEAVAKEKAEGAKEGAYSDAVDLLNDEQRNTLSVASADSFNLATFANRPYATKSSNTASILGLFYGYVDWWLHKLLSIANTSSRKGIVAGHLENLPFLLFAGLAFALVAMLKDDAIKWLKEYLLNQKGAYPRITEAKTATAAARATAGAIAADFPVVGGIASKMFDLGYSGGSNPYDMILALGVAKNVVDAGVETFQTGDATIPAMRLADRYLSPVPLHKLTDKMSGTRALINTGNILESEVRAQNEEEKLKPRAVGFERDYTPATPLITRAMNAIGNGDMPEFQKHYTALVEEYRKQGKSDPERNARQSLMTRNPISQRFSKRPSDADFQKYLNGLTPTERKIVTETLENYRQAMGIIGASPSFTAEGAASRGGSAPSASKSALPPSALPASSRSSGGQRTRSTARPRRIRGVRTKLTLGRRRTGRIRIRKPRRVRFSYAIRRPRRIRIQPRRAFI